MEESSNQQPSRLAVSDDAVPLTHGFVYSVARAPRSDGALAFYDAHVAVGHCESCVIMISTSGGHGDDDPPSTATMPLQRLLEVANRHPSGDQQIARLREALWEGLKRHEFRTVPSGLFTSVAADGKISTFRFGPVGVAMNSSAGVQLLHLDERFPSLNKLGVDLSNVSSFLAHRDDRLRMSIGSLYVLDPAAPNRTTISTIDQRNSLLLHSTGALPFDIPDHSTSQNEWLSRESGIVYGMSGIMVEVWHKDARATRVLPLLRDTNQARPSDR